MTLETYSDYELITELEKRIKKLRSLNPTTHDSETRRFELQKPIVDYEAKASKLAETLSDEALLSKPEVQAGLKATANGDYEVVEEKKKPSFAGKEKETLTCESCGKSWERYSRRGRKPRVCEECK